MERGYCFTSTEIIRKSASPTFWSEAVPMGITSNRWRPGRRASECGHASAAAFSRGLRHRLMSEVRGEPGIPVVLPPPLALLWGRLDHHFGGTSAFCRVVVIDRRGWYRLCWWYRFWIGHSFPDV